MVEESQRSKANVEGGQAHQYFAGSPERRPISRQIIAQWGRNVRHLFSHTLSSYQDLPPSPQSITQAKPEGTIDKDQLPICKLVYETEEARQEKLERKSTATISLVAAITPFIVAAMVYIRTSAGLSYGGRVATFVLSIFAFIPLLLAFIASLRATGIRAYQYLHIPAVIDTQRDTIRPFSVDFFGRGLLWCASVNGSLNNHIADFVRAAHVFLVVSVILLLASAFPTLLTTEPKSSSQEITGTVRVESTALQQLSTNIGRITTATTIGHEEEHRRLGELEASVSVLKAQVAELENMRLKGAIYMRVRV